MGSSPVPVRTMNPAGVTGRLVQLFSATCGGSHLVDLDKPFADYGLTEREISLFLRRVRRTFGIPLEPRDHRAAVSIRTLRTIVENKLSTTLLTSSLDLLALLEWSVRRVTPRPRSRFVSLDRPDVVVSHADLLALSAELARENLAEHAGRTTGPATAVIATTDPFLQSLAFLAALRCGLRPLITTDTRQIQVLTLPRRSARPAPNRRLVVVTDDTGSVRLPSGLRPDVVLPTEYDHYRTGADPLWVLHGDDAPDEVAYLLPERRATRPEGGGVVPVPQARTVGLLDDLSRLFSPNWADTVVSWYPLNHELGISASLLWPMVMGRSSTVMTPDHFLQDADLWLVELAEPEGAIGLAPPQALALATLQVTDETTRRLDLSGVHVLATSGSDRHDPRLTGFARRFAATGFSPHAFRLDSRVNGWPIPAPPSATD